jgi:hypothetical protein
MAKTWVLETHTKGTGANIVPLDPEREPPAREREPEPHFVRRLKPAPRPARPPEPKPPPRFRVVEVTTHRVLADGASTRATVDLLRDVRSVVDVAISVWSEKDGRYRLLTHGEQKSLWNLRDGAPRAARQAAGAHP